MVRLLLAASLALAPSAASAEQFTPEQRQTAELAIAVLRSPVMSLTKFQVMRELCGTEAEEVAIATTQPPAHRMIFQAACRKKASEALRLAAEKPAP